MQSSPALSCAVASFVLERVPSLPRSGEQDRAVMPEIRGAQTYLISQWRVLRLRNRGETAPEGSEREKEMKLEV